MFSINHVFHIFFSFVKQKSLMKRDRNVAYDVCQSKSYSLNMNIPMDILISADTLIGMGAVSMFLITSVANRLH